jgi:hypothetical protein
MKEGEPDLLDDEAAVVLVRRNADLRRAKDRWSLAGVSGGIDKMTVERKGNTTIIKIVSPEGGSYLDPGGWERPTRERRRRRTPAAKAKPA